METKLKTLGNDLASRALSNRFNNYRLKTNSKIVAYQPTYELNYIAA